MMAIPYYLQYYVESDRNDLYQWTSFLVCFSALLVHGILFHWIPKWVRQRRDIQKNKYFWLFRILEIWNTFNGSVALPIPFSQKLFFFQPSMYILCALYVFLEVKLAYVGTVDLNYEPRYYIIAKRLGRLASSNLPLIYIFVTKSDLLRYVTGLQHERLIFLHRWLGRSMWALVSAHMGLSMYYWLDLGFPVMMQIPPQIFGFIAYTSLLFLTWASLRFIRRLSFEFFLFQHRVFSFIMLLLALFHNAKGNKGIIIFAVHLLVIDRIVSRIIGVIHSKYSPTNGVAKFQILDDDTILVTIPVATICCKKWWMKFLPSFRTWKAGQHIYLTVNNVNKFQQHPFTIASLSDTGKIKLLIRKKKGFTRNLMNQLSIFQEKLSGEYTAEVEDKYILTIFAYKIKIAISNMGSFLLLTAKSFPKYFFDMLKSESSKNGNKIKEIYEDDEDYISDTFDLKISFHGPYGSFHQPLITFDSLIFVSAGSGASYTFPVALNLLQTIRQKEISQDFLYRPRNPTLRFIWSIKQIENILWYKHILEKFVPFTKTNRLQIEIHVSGESPCSSLVDTELESYDFHKESNPNEKGDISEGVVCFEEKGMKSLLSNFLLSIKTSVIFRYERPDVNTIINSTVDEIISSSECPIEKSLAVVSCGPPLFKHQIMHCCQSNRWKKNSPDIYCYSESYS